MRPLSAQLGLLHNRRAVVPLPRSRRTPAPGPTTEHGCGSGNFNHGDAGWLALPSVSNVSVTPSIKNTVFGGNVFALLRVPRHD